MGYGEGHPSMKPLHTRFDYPFCFPYVLYFDILTDYCSEFHWSDKSSFSISIMLNIPLHLLHVEELGLWQMKSLSLLDSLSGEKASHVS